jgi:acyl-CoA oxidase
LVDEKRKSWSDVNVECAFASHAHSQYIVLNNFIQALERIRSDQPALYPVMKRLCDLYALITIEKELGQFTEDGFISENQAGLVKSRVRGLLKELRPDVIGLVDAFDFPDFLLNSALGRYDGKVYESLYNWAQQEPLNQSKVVPGYAKHIRPMIKGGRL